MTETRFEVEIDTMLAELYGVRLDLERRIDWEYSTLRHIAGAKQSYQRVGRGHRKVWDMTGHEAEAKVREMLERGAVVSYEVRDANRSLERLDRIRDDLKWIRDEGRDLEWIYSNDPWSRFFLVTSSSGHVHSSMRCSTCNPRTTYAWLPHLSGLDTETAVAELGPALCSVCFPEAPVEWVGAKIKQRDAEAIARA